MDFCDCDHSFPSPRPLPSWVITFLGRKGYNMVHCLRNHKTFELYKEAKSMKKLLILTFAAAMVAATTVFAEDGYIESDGSLGF